MLHRYKPFGPMRAPLRFSLSYFTCPFVRRLTLFEIHPRQEGCEREALGFGTLVVTIPAVGSGVATRGGRTRALARGRWVYGFAVHVEYNPARGEGGGGILPSGVKGR
jgi:hypothetical protein